MFGRKLSREIVDRLVDLRFRQIQMEVQLDLMADEARRERRATTEEWRTLVQNLQQYNDMVAALTAKVAAQTDIDTSAVALIQGLKAQINDLITRTDGIVDVSQLQNLATALDAGTSKLAAAVAANTTPAPAPAPTPVVDPASPPVTDPNLPAA